MTKVTYYMYSCDTCCKIREMMGMNDLDSAKCQKSRRGDKTWNSDLLQIERTKRAKGAGDAVGADFEF